MNFLSQAYLLVQNDLDIDESLRTMALEQYVAAMEAAGMKDRAEQAKRDYRAALVTQGATTVPAN